MPVQIRYPCLDSSGGHMVVRDGGLLAFSDIVIRVMRTRASEKAATPRLGWLIELRGEEARSAALHPKASYAVGQVLEFPE